MKRRCFGMFMPAEMLRGGNTPASPQTMTCLQCHCGKRFSGTSKYHNIDLGFSLGMSWAVSKRINIDLAFNNLLGLRYANRSGTCNYFNTGEVYRSRYSQFELTPSRGVNFSNVSLGIKIKLGKLR